MCEILSPCIFQKIQQYNYFFLVKYRKCSFSLHFDVYMCFPCIYICLSHAWCLQRLEESGASPEASYRCLRPPYVCEEVISDLNHFSSLWSSLKQFLPHPPSPSLLRGQIPFRVYPTTHASTLCCIRHILSQETRQGIPLLHIYLGPHNSQCMLFSWSLGLWKMPGIHVN